MKPKRQNKTLYVTAEDAVTFDEAALLSGGSLSKLVASLVSEWLQKHDPDGERRATLRRATVPV